MIINNIDNQLTKQLEYSWNIRKDNFPNSIQFDLPTNTKPISISGKNCALDCAHCGGHYLSHMADSKTIDLDNFKHSSALISGGCDINGSVGIANNITLLKKLKSNNVKINMHTGLINDTNLSIIKDYADTVSFDFIVHDETINKVYNLGNTGQDYINTYIKLKEQVNVVPHICIGLYCGEIKGEFEALEKLKSLGATCLVFIIFIPTPNTKFSKKSPPKLNDVAKVFIKARDLFRDIPIHLGCMRPKGEYGQQVEYLAIKSGLNKIVNPSRVAIKTAKELNLEIVYGKDCCVL